MFIASRLKSSCCNIRVVNQSLFLLIVRAALLIYKDSLLKLLNASNQDFAKSLSHNYSRDVFGGERCR